MCGSGCRKLVVGLTFLSAGCATFWDEVTSRDRDWKSLMSKPDPAQVLATSTDGAKRGQALASLREPGGTGPEQDKYIETLEAAALRDREPLCRLGAVRALSRTKDPQAAKILEDVYLDRAPFTADLTSILKQQALTGLEQNAHPDSRALLIRVARQPTAAPDGSYQDRQQTLDERLTAVRALAKYKQHDAVDALVYVLETEKDVALRDRAYASLRTVTGKNLPPEGAAWRRLLESSGESVAGEQPGLLDRVRWLWKD